jgi:hypothetical protein
LLVQDCQISCGLLRLMYGETGQVGQVANRLERTLNGMEYPAALSCILLCPQASRYQVVIHGESDAWSRNRDSASRATKLGMHGKLGGPPSGPVAPPHLCPFHDDRFHDTSKRGVRLSSKIVAMTCQVAVDV